MKKKNIIYREKMIEECTSRVTSGQENETCHGKKIETEKNESRMNLKSNTRKDRRRMIKGIKE